MKKFILSLLVCFIGLSVMAAPELRPAAPDVPSEVQSNDGDYLPNGYKTNLNNDSQEKTTPAENAEPKESAQPESEEEDEVEEYNGPEANDGVNEEANSDNDATPEKAEENNVNQEPQNTVKENTQKDNEVKDNTSKPDNVDNTQPSQAPKKEKAKKNKKILTPETIQDVDEKADSADKGVAIPETGIVGDEENPNIKQMRRNHKKLIKQKKKEAKQKYKNAKPKDGKPDFRKYMDADKDPYVQSIYKEKTYEEQAEEAANAVPKTYTQDDYEQMYRDTPVPEFSYIHGVDPDQYYDMKSTTWSPYPLLRLNSPIYFKTITIDRGYYLLTPREYKGEWYILFKEAGVVKHIVPVIAKDYTPASYYRDNLPEVDTTKSARWQVKFLHAWGKYIRKSKRKPAIQTNLELTDLDNNFILLDLYYGHHKYSCLFRIEKY